MKRLALLLLMMVVGGVTFATQPYQSPLVMSANDYEEVFVDQVEGVNGFNGEEVTLNIYRTTAYDGEVFYIARKVYDWGESVYGVVTPEEPEEAHGYRHSAKVGLIGRYYFTSHKIPNDYHPSERLYN